MDPVGEESRGEAVEDVQRRLLSLGYDVKVDGIFGPATRDAVRAFRSDSGLEPAGAIDARAWAALVDASFAMGDRMLYLRMPYFHGGDVRELQQILDVLGFASGGDDGIFGAHTERALRDFQSSVGIGDDGIAGHDTFDAIARLRHAWEGKEPAAADEAAHTGFSRAAEVLERVEACFYGLDETGRAVSSRVANLAWATTPAARVTSADALGEIPTQTLLKVGVCAGAAPVAGGVPVVELADDAAFAQRLSVAMESADPGERRVVVQVPTEPPTAPDGTVMMDARFQQHLAVTLLDAFCVALG